MNPPKSDNTNALCTPLPPALQSRRLVDWFTLFGPGAVLASLTIGVGELVFSSRAGALFGYRLLWLFVLTLVLKWILVFGSARHIVLTGAHPFQRWMNLPGPRGCSQPQRARHVALCVVAQGRDAIEHEEAYPVFLSQRVVGFERVDDLPWTEIDFPEDLQRAASEVLPRIIALDRKLEGRN